MLSDHEILAMVQAEADDALGYRDEIGVKRQKLLDYYNLEPYGDEVDGRSRFVSSDVSDVVEWQLPSFLRMFTQGRHTAVFEGTTPETEEEADQKTELVNHVFFQQNDGTLILHNMMKDAGLQYTGTVKVVWKEETEVTVERYDGLSRDELTKLEADEETTIEEVETNPLTIAGETFKARVRREATRGHVDYQNIPPEEFVISRNARDFRRPRLIGHESPQTRSDLIEMGFDKEAVMSLPKYETNEGKTERYTRTKQIGREEENPTTDPANDTIYLGEYYIQLDVDEDGVAELWQMFIAGNQLLEKNLWDKHPFAVIVPVPMPHRAIGSCPAEQVADIQYVNTVLVRQALDNIYSTNYQRMAYNDRVDLDDLFTPRPGGGIAIEGSGPIADSLQPITTIPQTDGILGMVEYMNTSREVRTGITRYNQGLDTDSLNKTATGFKGIMDASQQRMELIARIYADTGIREIFRLTAMLLTKYQDTTMQIKVSGRALEIDPTSWRHNLDCHINVGLGSGDRVEKINNLAYILQEQKDAKLRGSVLADDAKMYETYDRLVTEVGLKDVDIYFNDPAIPEETLQAQVEMLSQQVQVLSQQNPLAEAEMVKAQAKLAEVDFKGQLDQEKTRNDMLKFFMKMAQDDEQFMKTLAAKLTELELEHDENVPGAAV